MGEVYEAEDAVVVCRVSVRLLQLNIAETTRSKKMLNWGVKKIKDVSGG